ncbi:MAG: DUF4124 domain-containing protein [Gammaproteobacteria bacterium]|nr:DUF4124 domain-containing protein [Gammaproteobacteria bacterium]NNL50090.1 DUF4124 domain-containing protein [Woeseiaceae bacterium]
MRHDRPKFARDGQSTCRGNAREGRLGLIIVSFCLLNTANAQTQIHKCTDADGGVAYSQLPCAPPNPVELEKTEPDADAESATPRSTEQELSITENSQEAAESETSRSACKKRYRDAIDVIDAEIRREYSPDKAEHYKQRLLLLTRELRQC